MDKTDTTKYFGRNRKQGRRTEEDVKRSLLSKTWVGRRLIRWAAVRTASPQKGRGTFIKKHMHRAMSRRCRFLRSATPFC
ncbi:hypothetical protein CsSME_00043275 [Camellia sinensis var. sinensis]